MKSIALIASLLTLAAWTYPTDGPSSRPAAQDQHATSTEAAKQAAALDVATAYLAGISGGDLDELDALFVGGDASTVFENSSNEGSWAHYKEHHLAPEQESVKNFTFTTDESVAEACGDAYLVRTIGGFSLEAGGETHKYTAAVSFMLAPTEDGLKIQHLHWSSRAAR